MRRSFLAVCLSAASCAGLLVAACIGDPPEVAVKADGATPNAEASNEASQPLGDSAIDSPIDGGPDVIDAGPPFLPTAFGARLALWLDGAKGVTAGAGNLVSRWQDQSSNANDALQTTTSAQPLLVAGGADGGVNGKPVVYFSGTSVMSITDNASLRWGTDDFIIAVVLSYENPIDGDASPTTGWSYGDILVKTYNVLPYEGFQLFANYPTPPLDTVVSRYEVGVDFNHGVVSTQPGRNDGKTRVVIERRRGASVELRIDGVSDHTNPEAGTGSGAIDVSATGRDVSIGANPGGVAYLRGAIAEIVGVHGVVTDAELGKLEASLKTKYGL